MGQIFKSLSIASLALFLIAAQDSAAQDSLKTKKSLSSDSSILAQKRKLDSAKNRSIGKDIVNDAVIFAEDGAAFFTVPFHLPASGWLWTAGIIGSTFGIMATDKEFRKLISDTGRTTYNHDILDGPTVYGFVQYPSMAAGALYLTGLFARNDWMRVTGRLWMEGLVYSGVTVMGMRYITGRYRPSYSDDPWKYTWFQPKGDTESFPSGHTVVAFATSTVLAERIDSWWARAILYPVAILTGYTRMRNSQHWLSDIVVGALLGFGSGYFVVHREKERYTEATEDKKGKKGGERGLSVYPSFRGIGLTYRF
jgi:PAP2 superfamily protein